MGVKAKSRGFILSAVFFLSGFAALIYQVSWQRLLSLHYGVGPVSTAIVVSIFMLGLGVGALIGGRLSEKAPNAILTYMLVEGGIGLFGSVSLPFLSAIGSVTAGSDYSLMMIYVSLFLLLPTVLMGMTLPIVVRILYDIEDDSLKNISYYYFINTMGASFGAIFCTYILISFFGIDFAVYAAVLTNILLAVVIFLIARSDQNANAKPSEEAEGIAHGAGLYTVLPLLFINGFMAIGYQIIWYRIVGVLLKDSAYSFSTILSIYLFGIGLGSYWLNKKGLFVWRGSRLDFYLVLNVMIAVTATTAIFSLYFAAGSWPLDSLIKFGHEFSILPVLGENWISTLGLTVFWPSFLILLPTFFMGAAFPVGISLLGNAKGSRGMSAGIGYAVTIAGNTLGGLVSAFFLLTKFGTINVLVAFATIQLLYVLILRGPYIRGVRINWLRGFAISSVITLVFLAPSSKYFYQKIHPLFPEHDTYYKEGVEGVVMVFEKNGMLKNFINGSGHGVRPGAVYVNEALVALSHSASPKRVLVIGFGAGTLLEAIQLDSRVESITLVELNRTAFDNLAVIPQIHAVLNDQRMNFIFDDGRRFLGRNQEKFDLVAIDPLRSKSAFSNNIYSEEFFRLVKENLSNEGVFLVWTDDATNRIDKGLARNFDYVNRYEYFLVATNSGSDSTKELYANLVQNLPVSLARDVQRLYKPPVNDREGILMGTLGKSPPTDMKPNLEYYVNNLLLE